MLCCILFFIVACSRVINEGNFLPPSENISINKAKTIAVLPFKNFTKNKELAKLVRISFYSHLSVRAFKDVELSLIDFVINKLHIKNIDISNKNQIKKLGKALHTDYLVYGEVIAHNKVFAAIYSLNSIEIGIKIVDTKTCKIVWNDRILSKQHEGGLPTSILSIPFISASTTMNMDKSVTITLIEDSCRILAYRIPSSLISIKYSKKRFVVQAGAFLSKNSAVSLLNKIRNLSFPCFIDTFYSDKSIIWYKVILGPFESLDEAQAISEKINKKLKINTIIKSETISKNN